jgi:D-sedoheptulose 7-phosphate isomerase
MTKSYSEQYFSEFTALFNRIEVTNARKISLSLHEGIEQAKNLIIEQAAAQKKIIFIGNGGSAAIAEHEALDYWRNGGIPALCFNDSVLLTCVSNDFGYEQVFAKPVSMFAEAGDVLVAISSSGKSANIINGAQMGCQKKCRIITLSGFRADNSLRQMGDLNFFVPSSSYGFVEIGHLTILHCIVDWIATETGSRLV